MNLLDGELTAALITGTSNEPREAFVTRMEAEGFRVVEPAGDELFIDIDKKEQMEQFQRMWVLLLRDEPGVSMVCNPSKSGDPERFHITVKGLSFVLDPITRIALQAVMGSDPYRELFSIWRVLRGDLPATLFAEKK